MFQKLSHLCLSFGKHTKACIIAVHEKDMAVMRCLGWLLVYVIATAVRVAAQAILLDAPIEWLELKVQSSKFSDPNVVYIGPSEIHGRGVMAAKRIRQAGKVKFLQYFEVSHFDSKEDAESGQEGQEGLTYVQGYIPEGSDIDVMGGITVKEGIKFCSENAECAGITYRVEKGESDDSSEVVPSKGIVFKSKGNVVDNDEWHSYIKKEYGSKLVNFPLGCSNTHLSRTELAAVHSKDLVACASRLVNHSCKPTCKMVAEDMSAEFAVPGLPWTKGRVKALYLHALRSLAEGEELTVDYNTVPFLMSPVEERNFICRTDDEEL